MKSLAKKLEELVSEKDTNTRDFQRSIEFQKLLNELKKTGIIKQPSYDLPLADTIGKNYYTLVKMKLLVSANCKITLPGRGNLPVALCLGHGGQTGEILQHHDLSGAFNILSQPLLLKKKSF
jgi:hypothetical protein